MRILTISDEVTDALYHTNLNELTGPLDLLLACGDLPYRYMEFIVTQARVRHAYFVHGNHDQPQRLSNNRLLKEPGGWTNIDRRSVYIRRHDLLVAGLEGSMRYKPDGSYQYSELEMALRARRLELKLLFNRVRYGRYLDIFISHAPAQGIHDTPTVAHRGFRVFRRLLTRYKPRLFLHGHNHRYGPGPWHTKHQATQVINVHPFCLIEIQGDKIKFGNVRHQP
jgi:Icc-related predicted phosphoesterase